MTTINHGPFGPNGERPPGWPPPPFDPPGEPLPYVPPPDPPGSSSEPRPDWWPEDWVWPPVPEPPIEVLVAILGGEPTLNPELISIIELARQSFPNAEGLFVTNGFFLDRHPDLPRVLLDNRFRMDVSQHGRAPEYMKRFRLVRQQLRQWRAAYPELQINIRKSHRGWRQQYRMIDGKPMPFESDPRTSWNICLQRTCTQLYKSCLWKCPALAYHAIMSRKLNLDQEPAWQLFRDYQACPPSASDEQVGVFLGTEEILQCGLCPSRRILFRHCDPMN